MDWGLLGHEWAAELLAEHIRRGEARHAYLFCGPAGVGRRSLALRFAQALNCPNPPQPGQPCLQDTCRSCRLWGSGQHPDFVQVLPASQGDAIRIDTLREITPALSLTPYEATYRIALLANFHNATVETQNALLKLLEEAPPFVILLLTADSPESLLPTVVSRCEILRLQPVSQERLEAHLLAQGYGADLARLLARYSGGRTGTALRLAADPAALERRSLYLQDALELLTLPQRGRFAYADRLTRVRSAQKVRSEVREQVREACEVWLSLWRDVLHVAAGSGLPAANPDMQAQIDRLAGVLGYDQALHLVRATDAALSRLALPLNLRLQAEALLMDWPGPIG